MEELFNAIRGSCPAETWSRGVELARADAVVGEHENEDEVVLHVATRGGLVSPSVTLYPDDEEWECSCSSHEAVCEHVAAAAIALRQARKAGHPLPSPKRATGTLRYCFRRQAGELTFEREIVSGDQVHRLATTLDAIASGRVGGPRFVANQADVAVERALGSQRHGVVDRATMLRLFPALERCSDIRLDGEPVSVSAQPVLLQAKLVDAPGGFRLFLERDPSISERFDNDSLLCGDVLRPQGQSRLTGRELEDLPRGRFYPNDQVAELVTEVLPSLEARIPLEIRSHKLPETERLPPRIAIEVERRGNSLSVLPTLVYGDPARARVDAGRLVHLGGTVPIRDEAAERERVRQLYRKLELRPGHRVELEGEEAVALADRLAQWRGEIKGESHRHFYRAPALQPQLRIEGERLDLQFESPAPSPEPSPDQAGGRDRPASGRASTNAVIRAWRNGEFLVPLDAGGFAPLPRDWLARFGDRVADLLAARQQDGTLPTCALPDLARLCEELDYPRPPALDFLQPLLADFEGIPRATLPDDVTAELRDYQRRGVDWLQFLGQARLGALLADDMGLGKTLQALCAVKGRTLVVAPTSVMHSWADEMRRFRPKLSFELYHGPRRNLDPAVDVTLTSYAILRLDADRLAAEHWDCAVLDEAQNIKNPESQVAQAAFRLRADSRIALTGTPVENRLEELWSQLHFLNRGLLGGRSDFLTRYARPIADGDTEAVERLRQRIRPFVLRRLKSEVARELPPRTEVVLHLDLDDNERRVYDAVRAATVGHVVEQLRAGGNVLAALEALLRLRQAACHPGLVPGQEGESSSKIELLLERLEQAVADGHKALVFSQWTTLLDRIEPHVRAAEIEFERLDGTTRDRGAVVNRFQRSEGAPVMLVSLKAGGTGLNLTAADHVFLMDPWWNPAVEDQAADRTHRIGQTRPVVVHRLVARETVEERILELHARKRLLFDAALGDTRGAAGLTREDLLLLLD
jgi:superfamily II DNA or RNA helicase